MTNDKAWLGRISLWSSILSVVLPGCFVVLDFAYLQKQINEQTLDYEILGYVISGFLFVTLELAALGCGIAARHTAAGKAGLVISAGIAILVLLFYLAAWIRFG
jgi:hypothetical protein